MFLAGTGMVTGTTPIIIPNATGLNMVDIPLPEKPDMDAIPLPVSNMDNIPLPEMKHETIPLPMDKVQ